MRQKVICSISSGETSGMMAYLLKQQYSKTYDIKYVFMNTSREKNRSLDFLNELDTRFNLGVIWLEAIVDPIKGNGIRVKITSYREAKRDGSVFQALIAKSGIPSTKSPHCTRDLKTRTCLAYMKSIGWENALIAIGYRFDESTRIKLKNIEEHNHWYPLYNYKITKPMVKAFYAEKGFSLGLPEWAGNCKGCFKKSLRKLLTWILMEPEEINWIIEMELYYPIGPASGEPVFFFREKRSIWDLIEMSKEDFELWVEPIYDGSEKFDFELDIQEDCSESCEAFSDYDYSDI